MVQTSVQFTPVQVLQAARRAEAEGKMDYALQFYRHLVEQHGTTPEAQEAREGLFRIAEWRWGEARVARGRDAANGGGQNSGQHPQAAESAPTPPPAPAIPPGSQRVYNVANNPPQQPSNYYQEQPQAGAGPGKLPQIISRDRGQSGEDLGAYHPRFQIGKFLAHALSGVGWITLLTGIFAAIAGFAGLVGELSAIGLFGVPFGIMLGLPALVLGLVLVVGGQLAAAVFASANANLELVAIERGRTSF
jgi:hypothetical protein